MFSARSYIRENAHLLELRQNEYGEHCRTPLGMTKNLQWAEKHPDFAKYFAAKRARLLIIFKRYSKQERLTILSEIFERNIQSTNDLSYGECLALIQFACPPAQMDNQGSLILESIEPRPEFYELTEEILEEVSIA